jgi:hypothetical protein
MFNGMTDGGYLALALPDQPVFCDARVQAYPESFWSAFQDAEKSAPAFRAWIDSLGVEWAVVTRVRERLSGFRFFNAPPWALVHWDAQSELWVRRSVDRLRPVVERYEYKHFRPYGSIVAQLAEVPRAQIPAFAAEVDRYEQTSPGDPFAALVRCGLATRAGSPAARALCDAAEASGHGVVVALVAKARALPVAP